MREGWKETTLGEVAEVLDRFRKPVNATEREQRLGSVPYYGATGRTGWIDEPLFNEELVLLGEDAIDFLNPTATKAYRIVGPAWVNNHAHVLRPIVSKILGMLLVELLNAVDYSQFTSYGTRSKLTQGSMMQITFLLPPLAEQKRIVDVIGAVDAYVASLESYAHAARTARAALLHELLTTNTKGWKETTLGEVADFINGYPFKPNDLGDEGIPVIRIKQLLDVGEPVDRTNVLVPLRCQLRDGDLVFSWSGTLAIRSWNRGPAYLNQHLFRVVEREGVQRSWLALCIDNAIGELSEKSHGTTMKHITKKTLLPHAVDLPPLAEQRRIVDVIGAVDGAIAGADRAAEDARSLRSGLLSDLLSGDHGIPEAYDELLESA